MRFSRSSLRVPVQDLTWPLLLCYQAVRVGPPTDFLSRDGLHDQTIVVNVATESKVYHLVSIDVLALRNWYGQRYNCQRSRAASRTPLSRIQIIRWISQTPNELWTSCYGVLLCHFIGNLGDGCRSLAPYLYGMHFFYSLVDVDDQRDQVFERVNLWEDHRLL